MRRERAARRGAGDDYSRQKLREPRFLPFVQRSPRIINFTRRDPFRLIIFKYFNAYVGRRLSGGLDLFLFFRENSGNARHPAI